MMKAILRGKVPKRGEKGFTLVELLIVLAILAVLAAVVIPNVTGMFGRGAQQAWETDLKTIQTGAATFYFDQHIDTASVTWPANVVHNYPTDTGVASGLTLNATSVMAKSKYPVYLVKNGVADAVLAEIEAAAIWMGLTVNSPGSTSTATAGGAAVPLTEKGPYLNEFPKSSSNGDDLNGNPGVPGGTYTWIIGQDGRVYGVSLLQPTDLTPAPVNAGYYAGFNGTYP